MLVDGTMFELTERYIPSLDRLRELIDRFYDVTDWLTNSSNTHIAQYLEKQRRSDNEIWSVDRM